MSSTTFDPVDTYYSGQGVVMIGTRDAAGAPAGLRPLGNCSAVKLSIATTNLEHKESHTGQRGLDLRLPTDTKATASITMESFNKKNLALALRGDFTDVASGSVTGQAFNAYPGAVSGLGKVSVSAVAVTGPDGSTALTAYTDEVTAWDYKENDDAGSLMFNDNTGSAKVDKLGLAVSSITVGATTVIAVPGAVAAGAKVGSKVYLSGFGGTDAAFLNGTTQTLTVVSGNNLTFAANTSTKTITTTGAMVFAVDWAFPCTVDFDYAAQSQTDALTKGLTDMFVRFEGLNTADTNAPVVVEIFRFSTDPLKDLDLISDGIGQYILEGSVLVDGTRTTGSKYFHALATR